MERYGFDELHEEFPVTTLRSSSDENTRHVAQSSTLDIFAIKKISSNIVLHLIVECKYVKKEDESKRYFIAQDHKSYGFRIDNYHTKPNIESSGDSNKYDVTPGCQRICRDIELSTAINSCLVIPNKHDKPGHVKEESPSFFYQACKQVAIAENYVFWHTYDYAVRSLKKDYSLDENYHIYFIPIIITNEELNVVSIKSDKVDISKDTIDLNAWDYSRTTKLIYDFALPSFLQRSMDANLPPRRSLSALTLSILVLNPNEINDIINQIISSIKDIK